MLVLPPPVKPVIRQTTRQKPTKYYTVHENSNNVLAFRGWLDTDKTTVLGFTREKDAIRLGRMIEKHYLVLKDWPDMVLDDSVKLYSGPQEDEGDELRFLHAVEWSPEDKIGRAHV